MTATPQALCDSLLSETRRRLFEESIPRAKKCLNWLTEEQIWHRPNEHSNSMGNLILHLQGNVYQWIMSGLGGQEDVRQRNSEFEEKGPLPTAQLIAILDQLQKDTEAVLQTITPEMLLQSYEVQGFQETGMAILIHVVEHFSYHVGQMTYVVKATQNMDTGYYAGIDLNAKR